ncbi:MAG: enoyl-CoA hydratase-related protein [Microthrixaceae bacterium]
MTTPCAQGRRNGTGVVNPGVTAGTVGAVYECFDVSISDGVAHVQLSRPDELNTMVPSFWSELPAIISDLDAGARARAIVLSSTGKHFSAGMDLSVFTGDNSLASGGGATEQGRRASFLWMMVQHLQDSFTALERARMPVLAAVQGGCIGGAVDMVSAADMRYCTSDAFFCIQEINIGMTADVGTLQRLPKIIPEGIARELAYTGDRMPAARAKEVGLVNEVFEDHGSLVEGTSRSQRASQRIPRWRSGEPRRRSTTRVTTRSPTPCATSPVGSPACSWAAT